MLYEVITIDHPNRCDAWDIDYYYERQFVAGAVSAGPWSGGSGPVRQYLEFELRIGDSVITSYSIHYTKLYDKHRGFGINCFQRFCNMRSIHI